jgi:hypothetical protein
MRPIGLKFVLALLGSLALQTQNLPVVVVNPCPGAKTKELRSFVNPCPAVAGNRY